MHLLSDTLSYRRLGILVGVLFVLLVLTLLLLVHAQLVGVPHHGPLFAPTAVEYAVML